MKPSYIKSVFVVLLGVIHCCSCKKQQNEFLAAKANNTDVVPTTITDYQAILDDKSMNFGYPDLGLAGSDNYYIPNSIYASLSVPANTAYIWAADIWQGLSSGDLDWNASYSRVEYANIVLDAIPSLPSDFANSKAVNNLKGSALFYRAFTFYNLASEYCKSYSAGTAAVDLGIPIRLTSDVNAKSTRATVQATYNQIISDLIAAIPLLPATQSYPTRPSSTAALALLAKVYFNMEDYNDAIKYATLALSAKDDLMDFNNQSLVNPTGYYIFPSNPVNNPEILFFASAIDYEACPFANGIGIDSVIISSYDSTDLRKAAFYYTNDGIKYEFQGTYDQFSFSNFAGLATNEIYLIRAECYARAGNLAAAVADLNTLLATRYVTGKYNPLVATNYLDVMNRIILERRKELPFTSSCRWDDLRRLNKDTQFAITLKRVLNNTGYTLPPNDPRYVYPIPDAEIQLNGMQQNQR